MIPHLLALSERTTWGGALYFGVTTTTFSLTLGKPRSLWWTLEEAPAPSSCYHPGEEVKMMHSYRSLGVQLSKKLDGLDITEALYTTEQLNLLEEAQVL